MPGNYGEYTNPTVGAGGCSYATLNNYNQNYFGHGAVGAPVMSQVSSNEVVIVPSFGGPGYNISRQRQPTCTGYLNVSGAYPNYPNQCGRFSSSLC
jgi:hypothetical protein